MKKIIVIAVPVLVAVFVVFGILWGLTGTSSEETSGGYKNATYSVEGSDVTLVNGEASVPSAPGSASQTVTKYFGNEAKGDLNGDGLPDVAFLITQSGGGSGTFYYVVAALQGIDGYKGTNAVLLGDRVAPQTTEIEDGILTVNYADRAAGEPMSTQPSVGVSKYLEIENGKLVESTPVACPALARACPDGSYVSPQGPKCEFPLCPNGQPAS